jgi:hypoxanthine phosphoribosyltransferase
VVGKPWALHTITSLPLDPRFPLFQHYPAMKLGVRQDVEFYARLLAPVAEKIIDGRDWVVTAPPLYVAPAGANLIAWEVCRILGLRCVDLRYTQPYLQETHDDYSKSDIEHRMRNRQELHEGKCAPKPDEADFRDRGVLFINDISVTGTQQHYVQRTLDAVHPARIEWLYVVEVDPVQGRSHPEVEYQLNHLSLDTFEEFAEIVARAEIDYTSRCITRLLRYPAAESQALLDSLDDARRSRLRRLIADEGLA